MRIDQPRFGRGSVSTAFYAFSQRHKEGPNGGWTNGLRVGNKTWFCGNLVVRFGGFARFDNSFGTTILQPLPRLHSFARHPHSVPDRDAHRQMTDQNRVLWIRNGQKIHPSFHDEQLAINPFSLVSRKTDGASRKDGRLRRPGTQYTSSILLSTLNATLQPFKSTRLVWVDPIPVRQHGWEGSSSFI